MPNLYQATKIVKVPLAVVVDTADAFNIPTVGKQVGDPWVHVGPGAKVDISLWPADRIAPSMVRGKAPEKHAGAGAAAKDKMIDRYALVPVAVVLPDDPPNQRTHPEKNIFRDDGSVRTIGVTPSEDEKPPAKPAAKAKKGGR